MSKVPFAEYKIGFEKFLKSESGTIYVQCKTFNEALSYSTSDRLYYWNFYKENTIFCLTDRGSTFTHIKHVREKGGKVFSCKGFEKRMKYFMYIDGKEGSTK